LRSRWRRRRGHRGAWQQSRCGRSFGLVSLGAVPLVSPIFVRLWRRFARTVSSRGKTSLLNRRFAAGERHSLIKRVCPDLVRRPGPMSSSTWNREATAQARRPKLSTLSKPMRNNLDSAACGTAVRAAQFIVTSAVYVAKAKRLRRVLSSIGFRDICVFETKFSWRHCCFTHRQVADSHVAAALLRRSFLKGAKPAELPIEHPTIFEANHQPQNSKDAWAQIPAIALAPRRRVSNDRAMSASWLLFCRPTAPSNVGYQGFFLIF